MYDLLLIVIFLFRTSLYFNSFKFKYVFSDSLIAPSSFKSKSNSFDSFGKSPLTILKKFKFGIE